MITFNNRIRPHLRNIFNAYTEVLQKTDLEKVVLSLTQIIKKYSVTIQNYIPVLFKKLSVIVGELFEKKKQDKLIHESKF